MNPVAPVFPRPSSLVISERNLAENQPEFSPLPVAIVHDARIPVLCRYRLSPEALAAIMEGGDLIIQQLTYGQGFHAIAVSICPQDENPQVCQ